MGRDEKRSKREGGRLDRNSRNSVLSHFCKNPNHETTKKSYDIKKQDSKQAKTGEVEINYKMFANPVFINPGRNNATATCIIYKCRTHLKITFNF